MNSIASALKGLKRNFSMTSASIILVLLTLLVVGSVVIIGLNAQKISNEIIDSISVYAYVDKDMTQEEIDKLSSEIIKIDHIDTVNYSSEDQQLSDLAPYFGENSDTMYDNFSGDDNPLYPVMEISITEDIEDLSPIIDDITDLDHVVKVNEVSSVALENLVSLISGIQLVGVILAIVLFGISLFIITNTIRLAITARRKEIEIMRLVGATKTYIRAPFIIEGFIMGLIGGVVSASLLSYGYYTAYGSKMALSLLVYLVEPSIMIKALFISLIVFGVIIGMLGSAIALRRYLRR